MTAALTPVRAGALVAAVAVAVYANSLGNGFAYDDAWVVESNPVVTEGRVADAPDVPYWPEARAGTGNYRPVTIGSFALEWSLFDGSPAGFHAVSVVAHAGVSLLVFLVLLTLGSVLPALLGALWFAVHPVHVEAVANVVGRGELYAAAAVLGAVLLFLRSEGAGAAGRAAALAGVAALYLVGLGSKEIAVTLPGLLVAVALLGGRRAGDDGDARAPDRATRLRRLRRLVPVLGVLAAVLGAYLVVRWSVLGALTGEDPATGLRGLGAGERLLTALTVWMEYLRLMVFPLDLSIDYQPAVLLPATGVTPDVVAGAAILGASLALVWLLRERAPRVALGLAWFVVAVLPVSNLVVRSDILLAERTLYLPSVGGALVVAGIAAAVLRRAGPRGRRAGLVAAVAAGLLLGARTVARNPTWESTYTALNTLAREHPESYLALRAGASGLEQAGRIEEARQRYELALRLAPDDYGLRTEVGRFLSRHGPAERAETLLRGAIPLVPDHPAAWRALAEHLLRTGRPREAHRVALDGLARVGADRGLWAAVSEAYVARPDLPAAIRARRAAVGQAPESAPDWIRLAELYEAAGNPGLAAVARERARGVTPPRPGSSSGRPRPAPGPPSRGSG